LAIIAQSGGGSNAGSAATVARAYQGGGKTDWFLPSLTELNELCKYARNQTTGNTATSCNNTGSLRSGYNMWAYWSSSQNTAVDGLYRNWGNGGYAGRGKSEALGVRPVRAFGPVQISVTTQPVGGASGAALTTQPVVRIVDNDGNTQTSSTASVTVTDSGGTVGGTTPVSAVSGVVTFTNLTHTTAGSYTLTFTTSNAVSVSSTSFTTS
jgi:hypothetical protein